MKTIIIIKNIFLFAIVFAPVCCKKSPSTYNGGNNGGVDTTPLVIVPPVEPPIANTIGFFINEWAAKSFTVPSYIDTTLSSTASTVTVTVDHSDIITKVPNSIFGQNANIWMTQMVTESSLLNHISNLHPNIIRFPGGSLSDVFFLEC